MLASQPRGVPLAQNVWPLKAALYRADSAAVPIEIADIDFSTFPGDTLALIASGDDDVFIRAGTNVRLMVTVDGVAQSYSLAELKAGVIVQRWSAAGPSHVSYRLSRGVAGVAPGTFRLEQQSNAQLTSARTPWVRNASTGASLAVAGSGTCDLDAASGTCNGVTYTISPYQPGVAFPAWQNAPGTGQSAPITVDFSKAVSSVTITIEDPTYAGNTMTAYAADGSVAGVVQFSFSGKPGTNIPDTQTITGQITRVVLTPPTGDYVTYHGSFSVDSLTLDCGATTVTRGDTITCKVSRPGTSQPVTVRDWRFQGRGALPFYVYARSDGNPTDTQWRGPLVTGGRIVVRDTNGDSAAVVMTVSDRLWNLGELKYRIDYLGQGPVETRGNVPLRDPALDGSLGETAPHFFLDSTTTYSGRAFQAKEHFALVTSGPNTNLTYATDVPGMLRIQTSVNFAAMTAGSWTWLLQAPTKTSNACSRQELLDALPLVMRHEGYVQDPRSHVSITLTTYGNTFVVNTEKMVTVGYPTAADFTPLITSANAATLALNAPIDDPSDPNYPLKCALNLFFPSF